MSQWVAVHTGTYRDPKLLRHLKDDTQWRVWYGLLQIAKEQGVTGRIDEPDDDIAWRLGVSPEAVTATIEALASCRSPAITRTEEGIEITHFRKYQRFPSDQPEAVAERVARHRERSKQTDVTNVTNVTTETRTGPDRTGHDKTGQTSSSRWGVVDARDNGCAARRLPKELRISDGLVARVAARVSNVTRYDLETYLPEWRDRFEAGGYPVGNWEAAFSKWFCEDVENGKLTAGKQPPAARKSNRELYLEERHALWDVCRQRDSLGAMLKGLTALDEIQAEGAELTPDEAEWYKAMKGSQRYADCHSPATPTQ